MGDATEPQPPLQTLARRRGWRWTIVVVVALAGGAVGAYAMYRRPPAPLEVLPLPAPPAPLLDGREQVPAT